MANTCVKCSGASLICATCAERRELNALRERDDALSRLEIEAKKSSALDRRLKETEFKASEWRGLYERTHAENERLRKELHQVTEATGAGKLVFGDL